MNHESILQETLQTAASSLQTTLGTLRRNLGYKSSRAFYEQYLCTRTRLDFNYSYYMKIEGGKIVPSAQIISNLCQALETDAATSVTLAYCESLFPERAQMFQKMKTEASSAQKNKKPSAKSQSAESSSATNSAVGSNQTYLTPAQIACVVKTKYHYFSFLILTLARRMIDDSELKKALTQTGSKLSDSDVDSLIEDLVRAKLIRVSNEQIESIANDMRFPVADSEALKKIYSQMDSWEQNFNTEMRFEPVIQKMMVRRVSSRYLSLIQAHCNVMIDLIRTSDELNPDHNDDVLMLNFSLQKGQLPG